MTQINWSLLQPVDIGGQFTQGLERGRQMAREHAVESALRDYSIDPSEPMDEKAVGVLATYAPERLAGLERIRRGRTEELIAKQTRERHTALGELYASGDRQGAVTEAVGAGDFELAKTLQGLAPDTGKIFESKVKAAAPFAYEALKLPDDASRKAFIQQNRAALEAGGWNPQEIDAYQGDAQTLQSVITGASTLEQLRERDQIKWHPVSERPSFATDSMGNPIGSQNPYANGDASLSPASPAPAVGAPAAAGALSFDAPPGTVTSSAYRDPAKNERVGGVPNSFHTRKDAAGNAMARDFVPPPGMSMAELAADLQRRNPGMDVINEGDHVHLEPKGGGGRKASNAAKVKADAEAAIRAGADPAKVRQRAAEMGVTL